MNPQIWIPLVSAFGGSILGSLAYYFVMRKLRSDEAPAEMSWRINRLEDAFIAHTGITLNGKPYKSKEH